MPTRFGWWHSAQSWRYKASPRRGNAFSEAMRQLETRARRIQVVRGRLMQRGAESVYMGNVSKAHPDASRLPIVAEKTDSGVDEGVGAGKPGFESRG